MDLQEIIEASFRLKPIIRTTPLLPSLLDPEVFLKAENLQLTGSFKIRTAYNQMALLSEAARASGVVTSSSGNFAQAAAYAGRLLGISTKIVMMKSSNPVKVAATCSYGGQVVFCEDRFEARAEEVNRIEAEERRSRIHPYDDPAAVAGNGTVALEILNQLPDVRNVVVPVSGGGLIAGIAFTLKCSRPGISVWGVQPAGSNAAVKSFRAGRRLSIARAETVADGLMVTQPGAFTFGLIVECVDHLVEVREESILQAVSHLLNREKLVVEPSGAVPLAAILEKKVPRDKTVLVLSGGNIRPDIVQQAFGRAGQLGEGTKSEAANLK